MSRSRREPYVPQHRTPLPEQSRSRPLHRAALLTGIAVSATMLVVSSGVSHVSGTGGAASAETASAHTALHTSGGAGASAGRAVPAASLLAARTRAVSRSVSRTVSRSERLSIPDPAKTRALSQASGGQVTRTADITPVDPRALARTLMPQFGFGSDQFSCLDAIYTAESGWNVHADNPTSDAYGIPQALPGSKMASAGADWQTSAATQIRWGLGYIRSSYGTPCAALGFRESHGWY